MIRFFVLTGLVGGALVAYLTTAGVGPISQLPPPESLLTIFREEGLVPLNKNLEEDETAEEAGVFEVPEADEVRLEAAQAAYDKMTGAMDMGAMDMAEPGAWMFMCMLPYHMQMGMMGQMATKGMAMDM